MQPRVGVADSLPPNIAGAAANLILDAVCARVVDRLDSAGIEAVVLKGPSIARWLYEHPRDRTYVDVDLLVHPAAIGLTGEVLENMGFEAHFVELPFDRPWYARSFIGPDDVVVEVHRTLPGLVASPTEAWDVLRAKTVRMEVAGHSVDVLDEPARAMHVALHAWHHGSSSPHVIEDLCRAAKILPRRVWNEARDLAEQLGAQGAFDHGLQYAPEELRESLGVAKRLPTPSNAAIDATSWFLQLQGDRTKARYLLVKMFPPTEFIRTWSPLARRSRVGLVMAHVGRPFWVVGRGVRGLVKSRTKQS